jgi:hypothetical protein
MSDETQPNVEPPAGPRKHRQPILAPLALAVVIFVCGGAAGWGVSIILRPPPPRNMGMPGPQPPVDGMVEHLRDELLLSDDQVKAVTKIYEERHDALESIRQKMEPQLKAEYDKLDEEMKGVLNSSQYQRWSERFNSVRREMLPPPPPGGPGMGPGREGPGGPGFGPGPGGPPPGPGGGMPP